jgi:hypothetical protein
MTTVLEIFAVVSALYVGGTTLWKVIVKRAKGRLRADAATTAARLPGTLLVVSGQVRGPFERAAAEQLADEGEVDYDPRTGRIAITVSKIPAAIRSIMGARTDRNAFGTPSF